MAKYAEGVTRGLPFRPFTEVFHLSKLFVHGVRNGIKMYFNHPDLFMNGVGLHERLNRELKVAEHSLQVPMPNSS